MLSVLAIKIYIYMYRKKVQLMQRLMLPLISQKAEEVLWRRLSKESLVLIVSVRESKALRTCTVFRAALVLEAEVWKFEQKLFSWLVSIKTVVWFNTTLLVLIISYKEMDGEWIWHLYIHLWLYFLSFQPKALMINYLIEIYFSAFYTMKQIIFIIYIII